MEWKKVSDVLPDWKTDVQIYCSDTKEQFVGMHIGNGEFQWGLTPEGDLIVCEPTHWMPLPPPPTE